MAITTPATRSTAVDRLAPPRGPERRVEAAPGLASAEAGDRELRALFAALMCAGPGAPANGWRLAEDRVRIAQRVGLEVVRVTFAAPSATAAWAEVAAVTPLALDVLAFLVDSFQAKAGDVRLVRCADILAAKRCRRQGEERLALEAQIGRELLRLGQFALGAGETPPFSVAPLGSDGRSFVVSREAGLPLEPRPGGLRIPRRLLEFDHRANRGADLLAKKLGLYFSLGGAAPGGRPMVRSVRTVLTGVGLIQEAGAGARCGRLADRFEEALLRLREMGLFSASYRGQVEDLIGGARQKGWAGRWLAAELVVAALP